MIQIRMPPDHPLVTGPAPFCMCLKYLSVILIVGRRKKLEMPLNPWFDGGD
jgi:hypothetical protein